MEVKKLFLLWQGSETSLFMVTLLASMGVKVLPNSEPSPLLLIQMAELLVLKSKLGQSYLQMR